MRTLQFITFLILGISLVHSYENITIDIELDQPNALKGYNVIVRFFIEKVVQPKAISTFFDKAGIYNNDQMENYFKNTKWQTILKDFSSVFLGFGIIAVLGVLTVILIIILGFITCCCRCCCSTKKDKEPESKDTCRRITCGTILFILCLTIVAVGCFGIYSSQYIAKEIKYSNMLTDINKSVKVLNPYISMARRDLSSNVREVINSTGKIVKADIKNFPGNTFKRFDDSLNIKSNLQIVKSVSENGDNLELNFGIMGTKKTEYQGNRETLSNELKTVRPQITTTLKDDNCNVPLCNTLKGEVDDLVPVADFSQLGYTTDAKTSARILYNLRTDLVNKLNEYEKIEVEIQSQGNVPLNRAATELDKIVTESDSIFDRIDSQMGDIRVSDPLIGTSVENTANKVSSIVGNALISSFGLLILIAFLFTIGIFCGGALPLPKQKGSSCCNSRHGSRLLMAGVAFFFIFGWIFYIIVTAFFLGGGIAQANACRHLRLEDNVLDRIWDVYKGKINVDIINNSTLKITSLLKSTRNGKAFYSAFELEQFKNFNVSDVLNLDKYDVKKLLTEISQLNIPVPTNVVPENEEQSLEEAGENFEKVKVNKWREESEKSVVKAKLDDFVLSLNSLIGQIQNPALKAALNGHIDNLRQLQKNQVTPMEVAKDEIKLSSKQAGDIIGPKSFKHIVCELLVSNNNLQVNGRNEIRYALGNQTTFIYDKIEDGTNTCIENIKYKVAPTKTLYSMFTSLRHISCEKAIFTFNVMWFSMGWILFFLQLSVFLALSLSKLYRKEVPVNSIQPTREEKIPIYTSSERE